MLAVSSTWRFILRRVLTACFLGIIGPIGLVSAAHGATPVSPSDHVDRIFAENLPGNRTPEAPATSVPPASVAAPIVEAQTPHQPARRPVNQGSIAAPKVSVITAARQKPAAPAPAATTQPAPEAPRLQPAPSGPVRRVSSTAYCLTGRMASGRNTYWGAAAMNGVPLGSRYQVLDGPRAGQTMVVEDRIGHGSAFDIAYPGNCGAARSYGRRTISIQQV